LAQGRIAVLLPPIRPPRVLGRHICLRRPANNAQCTYAGVPVRYNCRHVSFVKSALTVGHLDRHLIHSSLDPRVIPQTASRSVQPLCTAQPCAQHIQTHIPRYMRHL